MKKKDLVSSIEKEFGLKPGKSRKIVDYVLSYLLESGLNGEGFASPILKVVPKDLPERTVDTPEGQKTLPAKRVIQLRASKQYVSKVEA